MALSICAEELIQQGYTLVTRHLILAGDCHDQGSLYGGTLLSWVDEAASIFCRYSMGIPRVVTRAIQNMAFDAPVLSGETLGIYSRIASCGRTSLQMDVVVHVVSYDRKREQTIAESTMTWVALDEEGKPFEFDKGCVA